MISEDIWRYCFYLLNIKIKANPFGQLVAGYLSCSVDTHFPFHLTGLLMWKWFHLKLSSRQHLNLHKHVVYLARTSIKIYDIPQYLLCLVNGKRIFVFYFHPFFIFSLQIINSFRIASTSVRNTNTQSSDQLKSWVCHFRNHHQHAMLSSSSASIITVMRCKWHNLFQ